MDHSSFEKLIITHLVKKLPDFYGPRKSLAYKNPPLTPVLNHMDAFLTLSCSKPHIHCYCLGRASRRSCVTFRDLVFLFWPAVHPSGWSAVPSRLSSSTQLTSMYSGRPLCPQSYNSLCRGVKRLDIPIPSSW
jgi:hypothetical protein